MPSPATKMIAVFLMLLYAAEAYAWGDDGHRVVGSLAMEQIDAKARAALKGILGSTSRDQMPAVLSGPWSPDLVADWTNESRAYAKDWMYPETKEISCTYEQRALPFIDRQLRLAANRMAWILNSVLGEGQIAPDSAGSD